MLKTIAGVYSRSQPESLYVLTASTRSSVIRFMADDVKVETPLVQTRSVANIFNVIESVVLAMSVGLMLWVANLAVEHGKTLASHETSIRASDIRLSELENRGSRNLASHVTQDDQQALAVADRLGKLESAVVLLQTTPGELKAISVRLEGLREGQLRLEKALESVAKKP